MFPLDSTPGGTPPFPFTIPHRHKICQCFSGQKEDTKPLTGSGQHGDYATMTYLDLIKIFLLL